MSLPPADGVSGNRNSDTWTAQEVQSSAGSCGGGIGCDDFGWVCSRWHSFIVPEGVTGDVAVELRVGGEPVFQTPGGIWLATLVRGAIQAGSSPGLFNASREPHDPRFELRACHLLQAVPVIPA